MSTMLLVGRNARRGRAASEAVLDRDDRRPGTVLDWRRGDAGWRALVRYLRPLPAGYRLAYEHWVPGAVLEERQPR